MGVVVGLSSISGDNLGNTFCVSDWRASFRLFIRLFMTSGETPSHSAGLTPDITDRTTRLRKTRVNFPERLRKTFTMIIPP
jgi:hypothetical protein